MSAKKKGNIWENKIANWLRDNGFKAWKDGASGGGSREKGDIGNNLDLTIESKAGKSISLMKWWKQVETSASIQGNSPVLFIHKDGMRDNEWLVVLHSEDFLDYLKAKESAGDYNSNQLTTDQDERQYKYQIDRAMIELKKLKKLYE